MIENNFDFGLWAISKEFSILPLLEFTLLRSCMSSPGAIGIIFFESRVKDLKNGIVIAKRGNFFRKKHTKACRCLLGAIYSLVNEYSIFVDLLLSDKNANEIRLKGFLNFDRNERIDNRFGFYCFAT